MSPARPSSCGRLHSIVTPSCVRSPSRHRHGLGIPDPFVLQPEAELAQPPVQPRLHRRDGQVEGLGDLEERQALVLLQDQHLALLLGQRPNGPAHRSTKIELLDEVVLFYECRCNDEMVIEMIKGLPEDELAIQIPQAALEDLDLSLKEVATRVATDSRDLPAGTVGRDDVEGRIPVRVRGLFLFDRRRRDR